MKFYRDNSNKTTKKAKFILKKNQVRNFRTWSNN